MRLRLNEYHAAAMRTRDLDLDVNSTLIVGALGLAGEAGEVVERIKKHTFHGHELDWRAVVEELGDVMWYVTLIADALEVDLDHVATINMRKLRERYPDGFDAARSCERGETTS